MPPPSPTRKQQVRAIPTRPSEQLQRRHSSSSNSGMKSPKHPPTTYTSQFLRRRNSQQEIAAAREQQQRRMTCRHSSEDASGFASVQTQENGCQAVAAVAADMMAEKGPTDLKEETAAVAATPGKGTARNSGRSATMDQEQIVPKRVAMAKKRRAPCSRSAVVLAVVAGVVTVSVAGGIVLCRMYPTSPAAASIRLAASTAALELYTWLLALRGRAKPYTTAFGDVGRVKFFAVLKSGSLELKKPAHAAEELVNEWLNPSALAEVAKAATMCLAVAKYSRDLLQLAALRLIDVLKLSAEWMQKRLKRIIDSLELDAVSEAFEHVRSVLLTASSSLMEVMEHGLESIKSSLSQVFEWTGLESDAIDGNVADEAFVAPLTVDQAAIRTVARKLMTEQSRALEDVKRFEKRRVTIASAANSIIAGTRTIALESIVDAKMVATDFIEERTKELAERYAKALEQALEEFELTSRQVETEVGSQVVSKLTEAHVDTAASLKRDLTLLAKAVNEKLTATPVAEEHTAHSDGNLDGLANEDQSQIDHQLTEEEYMLEAPQSPAQGESRDGELVNEERRQTAANLAEEDQLATKLSGVSSSPENAVESDDGHDEKPLNVAVFAASEELAVELETNGEKGLDGEVKQTVVAEVAMDLADVAVEVGHAEIEVVKILDEREISEVGVGLQREDRVEVHFQVPGEGTGEGLPEVDEVFAANTERLLPDMETGVVALSGIGQEEELPDHITELARKEDRSRVDEEMTSIDSVVARGEQLGAEAGKVHLDADETKTVLSELQRMEEVDLASVRSNVKAVEFVTEGQTGDAVARNEAKQLPAEDREAAEDNNKIETVEKEHIVVAQELEGLEQLEQALQQERELARVEEELEQLDQDLQEEDKLAHVEEKLEQLGQIAQDEDEVARLEEELEQLERVLQEEGDLVDAEEELRAIAEREEIWLQSEQLLAKVAEMENTEHSNLGSSAVALPGSALVKIGFRSVVFLALAALAACFFLARHKRARLAHAPPRRKRWSRLADLDESDTEEVVLLPDDSSDEEEDAVPKKRGLEGTELVSSVSVETTVVLSSGGEEADAEEETSESHEVDGEELDEKEDDCEPVSMSTRSHTVVAKTTTYTVDHPATSSSEASAADGDNSSGLATPPPASKQATPDTAERSRRRRREIRT